MNNEREFKDLPEGWKFSKVKDLFVDGRGRIISEEEIKNKEGIYPVYSSQTSNNGELGKINTYDFEGEFITWTTDGANAGTVFYRNGKFNCTNVCGILKPRNENINVKFFSYLLSTIAKNYVSYIGNPKLMNSTFRDIKIIHPNNYYEQQKIAEILETVDNAIEKTDKIIEKYKRIKQGLMQDLLTKGIDENGNIRDEKTHKFKDSPLGKIPEEWEVVRLGEVGKIITR
jgi:type I restriction enzyme S subunit